MKFCSVKITIGNESIFVTGIYRPPDKVKFPRLDEILSDVLPRFSAENCVFLVGDLDSDILSSNNLEINSANSLLSHSFVPFINLPSRRKSLYFLSMHWTWLSLILGLEYLLLDIFFLRIGLKNYAYHTVFLTTHKRCY